jgi:hypothetical protein
MRSLQESSRPGTTDLKSQIGGALLVILTATLVVCPVLNYQQQDLFRLPDDGVTWTEAVTPTVATLLDVTWDYKAGQFVAVGRGVILVGDGAFQMTGWELGNCRRYGWDPIVLVFNNCSWEMLRTFEPESKFNDLDDWHFADMAAAMGGQGYRVSTRRELRDALQAALAQRGKFQLIEVIIPRGVLSDTLSRFVAGVRRLQKPAQVQGNAE